MQTEKHQKITTESGETEFQVRFIKDEGVGIITSKSGKNYLILDSLDYWYDLIQTQYPRLKKCSCKHEWFNILFTYILRKNSNDFKEIRIYITCSNCLKKSKALNIDIDYSPTEHLFETPITPCDKPKIKYKFTELTSYWSGDDLKDFLDYMFNGLNLNAYCWFFQYPEDIRHFEEVSYDKALQIITVNHRYLDFYFTKNKIDSHKVVKLVDEMGVYLKPDIWRKDEIIHLSSPISMLGYGLLYYIHFCNQYLYRGEIKDKSKSFEEITLKMMKWLKTKFISKRGKNCFDSEAAYKRLIKKRK